MKQNKFLRICKPLYFALVILSIYNLTNGDNIHLHNAMMYGHYSTLMPNTLLLIYLYYAANRICILKNSIVTRIGIESYYNAKKNTLFPISIIYLIFFYILNFALFPLATGYPVALIGLFVFLNTLQIMIGTVLIINFERKAQGLFSAILLNLIFHYAVIMVFFPVIERIIL